MAREHGEDKVLATYLDRFERIARTDSASPKMIVPSKARHV